MPMSSGGHAASSSACAIRPRGEEIGLTGSAGPTHCSSPTGHYAMATVEHREPCDSRGSCTILRARGAETPPCDSTKPALHCAGCPRQLDPRKLPWRALTAIASIRGRPGCSLRRRIDPEFAVSPGKPLLTCLWGRGVDELAREPHSR